MTSEPVVGTKVDIAHHLGCSGCLAILKLVSEPAFNRALATDQGLRGVLLKSRVGIVIGLPLFLVHQRNMARRVGAMGQRRESVGEVVRETTVEAFICQPILPVGRSSWQPLERAMRNSG